MKRLLPLLLLAGCVGNPLPTTDAQLVAALTKIEQTDLTTAIQIAQSVTPPDVEAIQCSEGLELLIPQLLPPPHQFIQPTGIASTFETLRIGWMEANSGTDLMTPAMHQQLEMACGPLALNTEYMAVQGILTPPQIQASALLQMLLALAKSNFL